MPLFQSAVDVCASLGFDWLFPWHECYPSVSRDPAMCVVSNSVQPFFHVTDTRNLQLFFRGEYKVWLFCPFLRQRQIVTLKCFHCSIVLVFSDWIPQSLPSPYNFVNVYLSNDLEGSWFILISMFLLEQGLASKKPPVTVSHLPYETWGIGVMVWSWKKTVMRNGTAILQRGSKEESTGWTEIVLYTCAC